MQADRCTVHRIQVVDGVCKYIARKGIYGHNLQSTAFLLVLRRGLRHWCFLRLCGLRRLFLLTRDTLLFGFAKLHIVTLDFIVYTGLASVLICPHMRGELTDHDSQRTFLKPL